MDEITDAELIRKLDGEPHAALPAHAEAHLAVLRRRSARLSELLGQLDPSEAQTRASAAAIRPLMTRQFRVPRALKIAAAIVLLFGLTLAVPPARAWMLERVRSAAEALGLLSGGRSEPGLPAPVSGMRELAPVRISFAVTTDTFDISTTLATGQLIVRHNEQTLGTAEATMAPGASFTVLRGLRIEGTGSAETSFIVTLPKRVVAVRMNGRIYALTSGEVRLDLQE